MTENPQWTRKATKSFLVTALHCQNIVSTLTAFLLFSVFAPLSCFYQLCVEGHNGKHWKRTKGVKAVYLRHGRSISQDEENGTKRNDVVEEPVSSRT